MKLRIRTRASHSIQLLSYIRGIAFVQLKVIITVIKSPFNHRGGAASIVARNAQTGALGVRSFLYSMTSEYGVCLKLLEGLRFVSVKCVRNSPSSSFQNYNIVIQSLPKDQIRGVKRCINLCQFYNYIFNSDNSKFENGNFEKMQ